MLVTLGTDPGYLSLLSPAGGVSARAFCVYGHKETAAFSAVSVESTPEAVVTAELIPAYIYNEEADVASSASVAAEFPADDADGIVCDGLSGLDKTPVIRVESDPAESNSSYKLCTGKDLSVFSITVSCCEAALEIVAVLAIRRAEFHRKARNTGRAICVLTQKFLN